MSWLSRPPYTAGGKTFIDVNEYVVVETSSAQSKNPAAETVPRRMSIFRFVRLVVSLFGAAMVSFTLSGSAGYHIQVLLLVVGLAAGFFAFLLAERKT